MFIYIKSFFICSHNALISSVLHNSFHLRLKGPSSLCTHSPSSLPSLPSWHLGVPGRSRWGCGSTNVSLEPEGENPHSDPHRQSPMNEGSSKKKKKKNHNIAFCSPGGTSSWAYLHISTHIHFTCFHPKHTRTLESYAEFDGFGLIFGCEIKTRTMTDFIPQYTWFTLQQNMTFNEYLIELFSGK